MNLSNMFDVNMWRLRVDIYSYQLGEYQKIGIELVTKDWKEIVCIHKSDSTQPLYQGLNRMWLSSLSSSIKRDKMG